MKIWIVKWSAVTVAVALVILGCSSVVVQRSDEDLTSNQSTNIENGFGQIESEFTDASLSPGGLGVPGDPTAETEEEEQGEETRSFFTAFQIDPEAEDTAGPKFVVEADIDRDGMVDLVTGWNQSQPVQLHLQRRDAEDRVSFRTINLGGTTPLALLAGVEVGFIDDDEWLDVVVLAKANGFITLCPTSPPSVIGNLDGEIAVLFSPGNADDIVDGDAWTQMTLVNPFVRCRRGIGDGFWVHDQFPGFDEEDYDIMQTWPEIGGFTSLAVGDIDGLPGDDIVVALNTGVCDELGQEPPTNTVDLWLNPGPGLSKTPNEWGTPFFTADATFDTTCPGTHAAHPPGAAAIPYADFLNVPVALTLDAPPIRDIELLDVDGDGDLDVLAAVSNAISKNIRWLRNPAIAHTPGGPSGVDAVQSGFSDGWRFIANGWQERPVGQLDTGADKITLGDVDGDGAIDVVVRSNLGVVQWFRHPTAERRQPEFPPPDEVPDRLNFPWEVYTLTEFDDNQRPEGVALGDITGDGILDLVVAAEGAAFWYDSVANGSVYDPWAPNTIIQDTSEDMANAQPVTPGAGVGVTANDASTVITELLVVDIDGDGKQDIVGTLDRRSGPGLSDDRLVWYKNTKTEDDDVGE